MAKTRMYRKKGRKTMRRGGARKTRRIRRGGNINDDLEKCHLTLVQKIINDELQQ